MLTKRLAPSILSCNPAAYGEAVLQMIVAGASMIHLDVMDGQFVPPITFGADLARALRELGVKELDAHLMTLTPERHLEAFSNAGCTRMTFHLETTEHPHRLAQSVREQGMEAAIALNPGTSAQAVEPLLSVLDAVLVMTVNPGWGGQAIIPACIEKVRQIRRLNAEIDIVVDGGVDERTIGELAQAGATTFVTGSYLVKADSYKLGMEALIARW